VIGVSGTYTDQDTLVLEVDIGDGELVGERHCGYKSVMSVRGSKLESIDR